MSRSVSQMLLLTAALVVAAAAACLIGEVPLSAAQYAEAFRHPGSAAAAERGAVVGAALGLAGAVMQGLLRNPLADPAVLGVSAFAGLGASIALALGLAAAGGGAVEAAALVGALAAGAALTALAARLKEPEALILFGVALSAMGGALTALVFNLSPSPVATAEVLSWLMGSVENRSWADLGWALPPMLIGSGLCAYAARGLTALSRAIGRPSVAAVSSPRVRAVSPRAA